jgi:hypothetical protein
MKSMTSILLFTLLCVALAVSGCGSDTSSPENAVKAFHEATRDKDKERLKKVLSKDDLKNLKETEEPETGKKSREQFQIGTATIDGDKATVLVSYILETGDKTEKPMTWHCVREDGDWKVALGVSLTEAFKEALKAE